MNYTFIPTNFTNDDFQTCDKFEKLGSHTSRRSRINHKKYKKVLEEGPGNRMNDFIEKVQKERTRERSNERCNKFRH